MNCDTCANFEPLQEKGNTALLAIFTAEQLFAELNRRRMGCAKCKNSDNVSYEGTTPYGTYCWECLWHNLRGEGYGKDNFMPITVPHPHQSSGGK